MKHRLDNKSTARFGIGLLVLCAAAVTLWQVRTPIHITREDGFYFYEIARNLAHGAGSTFDGVNPTNGYQPLWLLMLVPVFWVAPSGLDALRLGIVLQGILLAATLALLFFTARLKSSVAAALFGAFLWLVWMAYESFSGLETSLHAVCLCIIGLLYLKQFIPTLPKNPAPFLALGIVCSIAFLARLDTLALGAILGLALGIRGWQAHTFSWRNWLAFAIPLLFTICVYAFLNFVWFGSPVPISGIVKESWSQTLVTRNPLFSTYGWFGAKLDNFLWSMHELAEGYGFYVTLGTFGAGALWLAAYLTLVPKQWRETLKRLLTPLTPFLIYSLVNYTAYALLFDQNLSWTPSYYIIQPWLVVVLAAVTFDAVWRYVSLRFESSPLALTGARYAILLIPLVLLVRDLVIEPSTAQESSLDPIYAGAEWARTHLPSDAVLGAWNAGTIGYLSERRTVNLDGVVNSFQFFRTDRFDLCAYWKEQGINYLMDAFTQNRALSIVPTFPAYAPCASALHDVWSDALAGADWRLQVYRVDLP